MKQTPPIDGQLQGISFVSEKRMRAVTLALALGFAAVSFGCAASAGETNDEQSSALETLPNGLSERSLEAEGVRLLANDRSVSADVLVTRAGLSRAAADAVVEGRKDRDGSPRWFRSVSDVLSLPAVDIGAIDRLVLDATASGYVEKPGFDEPRSARLAVEREMAHPKESDITVEAGFDGLAPDAVVPLVRGRLTNVVHGQNESFVAKTIRDNHKAFTIAAWNLLSPGSPPAEFARRLRADKLTLLGTMSTVKPTILMAERGERTAFFARGEDGAYAQLREEPKYPVIMRARIRLEPVGVRVHYPDWSAPVLAGPTSTVTEGP